MSMGELDIIVGQIEDELRNVKAARDQVESILGTNNELSKNLTTVVLSLKQLINASNKETQQAAFNIQERSEELSKCATGLEQLIANAKTEITNITGKSEQTIEQISNSAAKQAVKQIQETNDKCISRLQDSCSKLLDELGSAKNELNNLCEQLEKTQKTLIKTSESANKSNSVLLGETKELLESAQVQLSEIQSIVDIIKNTDYAGIKDSIDQLQSNISKNQQNQSKQNHILSIMAVMIIILEITILACNFII